MSIIDCKQLTGVGPRISQYLAKLGVYTASDLLLHAPLRYEDRTRLSLIAYLSPGQQALLEVSIVQVEQTRDRRRSVNIIVQDSSGQLTLRFFKLSKAQQQAYKPGLSLRCYGEIRCYQQHLEMVHPECEFITPNKPTPLPNYLTAIYPSTAGMSQYRWRQLMAQGINLLQQHTLLPELLPPTFLQRYELMPLTKALQQLHRPPPHSENDTELALQRLRIEELLAYHMALRHFRQETQQLNAIALPTCETLCQQFLQQLPFSLTAAQQRVSQEIANDLQQKRAMSRLIQGDVGSGKTVVAMLAMLQAIANGYQAVMMAPTELLAEQHYQTISQWLSTFDYQAAWLAGSLSASQKKKVNKAIAAGEYAIIIGTHAVFQTKVSFKNLALVIVDEQHRFGVQQRLSLRQKGMQADTVPHQLVMSATPIPRTLAMVYYADLDCSIIDELPQGRKGIQTIALSQQRKSDVITRIKDYCAQGSQVYWVCPLIEESELVNASAAEQTFAELKSLLPHLSIGLVHGRLKAKEKEAIMRQFKQGELEVLVATTVIEVGVDVPNANLMIIENAERLGLAQLHQLRGRVGRGQAQSFCVLLYQAPLSNYAKQRLQTLRNTNDGFIVAEKDLQLRGPGEILGKHQTGIGHFRFADLQRDRYLLPMIERMAHDLNQQAPKTIHLLIERWFAKRESFVKV